MPLLYFAILLLIVPVLFGLPEYKDFYFFLQSFFGTQSSINIRRCSRDENLTSAIWNPFVCKAGNLDALALSKQSGYNVKSLEVIRRTQYQKIYNNHGNLNLRARLLDFQNKLLCKKNDPGNDSGITINEFSTNKYMRKGKVSRVYVINISGRVNSYFSVIGILGLQQNLTSTAAFLPFDRVLTLQKTGVAGRANSSRIDNDATNFIW